MNVSPEVMDWVRKAEADLAAAPRLVEGPPPLPDQTGFFCQQSAEKYLKSFLLAWGQLPPRTHDVDVLVELSMAIDPDFSHLQQVVEGLTEYAVIFRYPEEWSRSKRSECVPMASRASPMASPRHVLRNQRSRPELAGRSCGNAPTVSNPAST